jgi:hypothetical protein
LEIGRIYYVKAFISRNTKFGKKIIARLANPSIVDDPNGLRPELRDVSDIEVWLPERFANIIEPSLSPNVGLCYNGMKRSQNGFNYHDIVFN